MTAERKNRWRESSMLSRPRWMQSQAMRQWWARTSISAATVEAARADAGLAVTEFDAAREWLVTERFEAPFGAETWVFDQDLTHILLVQHPWRGWVPPGGRVEPDETPREAARRELFEETGLAPHPLGRPAAVALRSYKPGWPRTLGLSYAAIADIGSALVSEPGQPAKWHQIGTDWESTFEDDPDRIRDYVAWLDGNPL